MSDVDVQALKQCCEKNGWSQPSYLVTPLTQGIFSVRCGVSVGTDRQIIVESVVDNDPKLARQRVTEMMWLTLQSRIELGREHSTPKGGSND